MEYLFFTCKGCGQEQNAHIQTTREDHALAVQEGPDDDGVEVNRSPEAHRCRECGHLDTYEWSELYFHEVTDGG